MKTIQDYKKEFTLKQVFRYPEGVLTRAEWLSIQKRNGSTVSEEKQRNRAAEDKLEQWIKDRAWKIPFGNDQHPDTKEWLQAKETLKQGIFKTVYRLYKANTDTFTDITKTEFNYFNSL